MKALLKALCLLLGCLLPGWLGAQQICPDFDLTARVTNGLPSEVGDARAVENLLNPRIAPGQLGEVFRVLNAAKAVGDHQLFLKPESCESIDAAGHHHGSPSLASQVSGRRSPQMDCVYKSLDKAQLRAKVSEGRYAYVNWNRSHRGFAENDVSQREAAIKTLEALIRFGIPRSEIVTENPQIRDLVLSAQKLGADSTILGRRQARAEVHVLYQREVDGIPVFDSFGRAAVNVQGKLARLHINWPDFCIAQGAFSHNTRSEREVINSIVGAIEAAGPVCDTVGAVGLRLAYVQVEALTEQIGNNSDDEGSAATVPNCYVPSVVVAVVGPDPGEDSGKVSLAGQLLAFPLLRTFGSGIGDGEIPIPQ